MKKIWCFLWLFLCCSTVFGEYRIAVLCAAVGEQYAAITRACIENKKEYCKRHGYDFICAYENLDPTREPAWTKIRLIEQHLADYDWIFWSDADSLFMNMAIRLETYIDNRFMMIITRDFNTINSGQFFLKNSQQSFDFLRDTYALRRGFHPWYENASILEYFDTHPDVMRYIHIVNQRQFNSYPSEIFSWVGSSHLYHPGDFIIHFPSARGGQLVEMINVYKNRVWY